MYRSSQFGESGNFSNTIFIFFNNNSAAKNILVDQIKHGFRILFTLTNYGPTKYTSGYLGMHKNDSNRNVSLFQIYFILNVFCIVVFNINIAVII